MCEWCGQWCEVQTMSLAKAESCGGEWDMFDEALGAQITSLALLTNVLIPETVKQRGVF